MSTTVSGPLTRVLAATTLDAWSALDWSQGLLLTRLDPHDRIVVRTRNSTYELIVMVPHTASVLVRGGKFFPAFTPARVAGSSLGGSVLKLDGVYPGFQMELIASRRQIVTTRVRTCSVVPCRAGEVM